MTEQVRIPGIIWNMVHYSYQVYIVAEGEYKNLGLYRSFLRAVIVRRQAEIKYYHNGDNDQAFQVGSAAQDVLTNFGIRA